jgi:phage N-6-adenine-methyltransferase
VDERITPAWLFDALNSEFAFTLDAAANARNAKVPAFRSLDDCGLAASWAGERVWCNPPYSDIAAWVAKARAETADRCWLAVLLLPANRTEQRWWQEHIEPLRDGRGSVETRFLARRFNFGVPGNEGAMFNSSPPFGCVAVIYRNPLLAAV